MEAVQAALLLQILWLLNFKLINLVVDKTVEEAALGVLKIGQFCAMPVHITLIDPGRLIQLSQTNCVLFIIYGEHIGIGRATWECHLDFEFYSKKTCQC